MDTILLLATNENFKIVNVVFSGSPMKTYSYLTTEKLAKDDFCVVLTPDQILTVVQVREVIEPLEYSGYTPLKWVVCKVDLEKWESNKAVERNVRAALNTTKQRRKQQDYIESMKAELGNDAVENIQKLSRL